MWQCSECKCQFVCPPKCITCGAESLYDATVRSLQEQVQRLLDELERIKEET
jgi:hypothetical protein